MKVLMFGWEFPPWNSGGLGVACEGLTRALAAKGVELIFVLPKKLDATWTREGFLFADEVLPGIFERTIAVHSPLRPYVSSAEYDKLVLEDAFPKPYGTDLFFEVKRYGRAAARIARTESFDVIHAHDWLSSVAGRVAKEASGKPLIIHVHATEYDRTGGRHPHASVYALEKAGFEAADLILTVSEFTKNQVVERYGIPKEKILVCHNGIDPAASSAPPTPLPLARRRKLVLFVGRLTLQKGPDYFLRAAQLAASHEPKAIFVLAGSGDMERELILLSAELGLNDRVMFAGFLRGAELERLYASACLFVLPSVSEPFGLTALEAARAGIPVILSRQSGVSELLHHCLKVDFWDVRDTAARMVALLRYPALRDVMGTEGRNVTGHLSWERSAERCIDSYGYLMGRSSRTFA